MPGQKFFDHFSASWKKHLAKHTISQGLMNIPFYSLQGWIQLLAKISCKKPNIVYWESIVLKHFSPYENEVAMFFYEIQQLFPQDQLHLAQIAGKKPHLKCPTLILWQSPSFFPSPTHPHFFGRRKFWFTPSVILKIYLDTFLLKKTLLTKSFI